MPTRRSSIAALVSVTTLSLAVSCSHGGAPRAKSTPRFPDAFKPAPAGSYRIVAAVPLPGATTDERARLRAPVAMLPAPDGGLIVVTQNDISTFTEITKNGDLKPYLLDSLPRYANGRSPAAPTAAYVESGESLILITRIGEIVRMTDRSVRRLGMLPKHTGATLITNPKGGAIVQQGNQSYRAKFLTDKATVTPFAFKGVPSSFALQTFSNDGATAFFSDGEFVLATSASGKSIFKKSIRPDGSISSMIPDERDGAWIGDDDGGITHISANGGASQVNESNAVVGDCTSRQGRAPLGAVYSMLRRGSQLYVADKQCNIIATFGLH